MLEELRIRGLGVIDDATLPLGSGLTVVTGETGAGKTMVVSGLLLLFGGRGDAARVRTGSEQATVDGRLEIAADSPAARRVADAGGELDDGTGLVLRRTVSSAGRSRAFVGGAPTPVAVLGELAERLLAVHGQSDQLRLSRPADQRAALDRFAGLELDGFAADFQTWRDAARALDERRSRIGELRREADLLAHGLAEIEAVAPQPGEDVELAAAAGRLAHADALRLAAQTAHNALVGDPEDPVADAADVAALLGSARRVLSQQDGADRELDQLTLRVSELAALAADLGAEFGAYAAGLDADPARLEQLEQRRAVLNALVRKYGDGPDPDLAAVADWAARAGARLTEIDVSDEAIAALEGRRDEAAAVVAARAAEISARRHAAAAELGAAVTAELAGLAMPHAVCTIAVRPRPPASGTPVLTVDALDRGVGPDGADEVEVLLQSHPDAPALPIARGASGGELSRVMLAIEVCLAGTDPVPTMVFDEVDAGVGGRAATEVGRRLARLSRRHQVIVVTHLAQVAAYADRHIVVDKQSAASGVTASDVHMVQGEERLAELARMLGGSASDTARKHAAELARDAAEESADLDEPAAAVRRAAAGNGRRPPRRKAAKTGR
jgi:DNA repair protein RecN (Recombination protein N)